TLVAMVLGGLGPAGRVGEEVSFTDRGVFLGTALLDASGAASLTIPGLSLGGHYITASYPGDGSHVPSSAQVFIQVLAFNPRQAGTALPASPAGGSVLGAPASFTAQVSTPGGFSPDELARLMVSFRDGDRLLGIIPVDSSGRATFTTLALAPGAHRIVATPNAGT